MSLTQPSTDLEVPPEVVTGSRAELRWRDTMTQALPRLPVHEAEPKVEDRTKNECEKPTHECKVRLGIRLTQELNGEAVT